MKKWLCIAAVNGALGVIAGAVAAHMQKLGAEAQAALRLGAGYQLSHGLAMGLAALAGRDKAATCAGISACLFLVGILLFSGALYLQALTGAQVAFLIPFGGSAFIAGWIALAVTAMKWEAR